MTRRIYCRLFFLSFFFERDTFTDTQLGRENYYLCLAFGDAEEVV